MAKNIPNFGKRSVADDSGLLDATQKSTPQSPKNTGGTSSSSTVALPSLMASPTNNGPYVQICSIEVSKPLQDGEKFIKWDEVSLSIYLCPSHKV